MTIYTLDLRQIHDTIRATLAEQVLPAVQSLSARSELLSVIEMLDSLQSRLSWDSTTVRDAVSRTVALGSALGFARDEVPDGVDGLRAIRERIAAALSTAYETGPDADVIAAVADFSRTDIRAEISPALRAGLAD